MFCVIRLYSCLVFIMCTAFCVYFITEIGEFQTVVGGFINIVDKLANQVEQEKMKVNYIVWSIQ